MVTMAILLQVGMETNLEKKKALVRNIGYIRVKWG